MMFFLLQLAIPFFITLLTFFLVRKRARRLPPGPAPVPLLGNINGLDALRHPWKTSHARFFEQYGDIIYLRLPTQEFVIINSDKIAQDLLERRSHKYSSRGAPFVSLAKFMGTDFLSILLPYGDRWRLHRRLFHQAFQLTAAPSFRPIQMRKTHEMLTRLMLNPLDCPTHLHTLSSSLIMAIVYDYEASGPDDPILVQLQHATEIAQDPSIPETALILYAFPFLKCLPAWFPGASFKRRAMFSRMIVPGSVDAPFEHVKKAMAAGTAASSMVSDALSKVQDRTKTEAEILALENDVKEACASAYAAAAETTHSTLMIFVLAMMLYPEVQTRAQAEIDSIIGGRLPRLPHWEDRPSLPYVEAVVKETLRWHPAAPLGIPHATVNDDIYEGYHIPKGAIVIANAWAISHDPIKFPEPRKFKPERFLDGKSQSVHELPFAFGFGRRICVGRHVADASLWISIVSLLAVFRFEAPPFWDPGPDGANVKWAPGVTTRPEELPCKIKPRHENFNSERLAHLIGLGADR